MSTNLIKVLVNAAEKASNIARICRTNEQLLALLVQEKTGDEANDRFEHDFKALADVLIQETVKHDVGLLFPNLRDAIRGEESSIFTNKEGKSVNITVGKTEKETLLCLDTIFHGFDEAAKVLAAEVHRKIEYTDKKLGNIPDLPKNINYSNLAVWIDPIDATSEYISAEFGSTIFPCIPATGLDCVTVLIGVYDRITGEPIIGVISQPFHTDNNENIYKSRIFWGVALPNIKASNCDKLVTTTEPRERIGIFSGSENDQIVQALVELGYTFVFSAGAGHKALKVITCDSDVYVLSKGTTFKWDTCAPQAILRSVGGEMYDFRESVKQQKPIPLSYLETSKDVDQYKRNSGGLLVVRDLGLVDDILKKLANKITVPRKSSLTEKMSNINFESDVHSQ